MTVPYLLGTIGKGLVTDTLVDFTDILPTVCEVAGASVHEGYPGDGVSFLPTLKGKQRDAKPWVYFWYRGKVFARTKEYKYACNADLTGANFLDVSTPYSPKELDMSDLTKEQQKAMAMLKGVVEEMVKTRPAGMGDGRRK